jgi:peptidoglycan/xylan/chitin deacetylase (PgdA/CDA1 family)
MKNQRGTLVISLDFELYWGIRDKRTIEQYKDNLLGVRKVIPLLLGLFNEYQIHATWAVVGFLFFKTKEELLKGLPQKKPDYEKTKLNPYTYLDSIGNDEHTDPFHYAPSLIEQILSFPNQEIGSHTFSHYYCLEKGQNIETFKEDLHAAINAAKRFNVEIKSLVFPRNQTNAEYLSVCKEMGIKCYRGNETSWLYKARNQEDESLVRRGIRLMDAYVNISGHNTYTINNYENTLPLNIHSSRFLRPYSNKLHLLEPLRLHRILSDLTYAAKKKEIFHLWWHPHNFGVNMDKNMQFLRNILDHYTQLHEIYSMESLHIGELANRVIREYEL